MKTQRYKNWWFLSLKGILLIIFGLLAIFNPDITIKAVILYLGVVFLITGVVYTAGAIYNIRKKLPWELWVIMGIIDLIIGAVFVFNPELSLALIITIIGIWAIILGLYQIITFINMKRASERKDFYLVSGIIALLIGILFLVNPFAGGRVITVLIGIFTLIMGILIFWMSLGWRKK